MKKQKMFKATFFDLALLPRHLAALKGGVDKPKAVKVTVKLSALV